MAVYRKRKAVKDSSEPRIEFIDDESVTWDWLVENDFVGEEDSEDDYDDIFEVVCAHLAENDADKVKYNGNIAMFQNIGTGDFPVVLVDYGDNEAYEIQPIIESFFSDGWKDYFTKAEAQSWGTFSSEENVLAYRGGSGYVYTIYTYNPAEIEG